MCSVEPWHFQRLWVTYRHLKVISVLTVTSCAQLMHDLLEVAKFLVLVITDQWVSSEYGYISLCVQLRLSSLILCFCLFSCWALTSAAILSVAIAEYCTGNADWSTAKIKACVNDEEGPRWWQIWYAGLWKSYASCFKVAFYHVLANILALKTLVLSVSFQALNTFWR